MQASFHSHHSPFGAFASFTLGLVHSQGGFGQSLAGPAAQNLYIGFKKSARANWKLLPYFLPARSQEGNFTGIEGEIGGGKTLEALAPDCFSRHLSWCSDTWRADGERFGFSLLSPIASVPEPSTMEKKEARLVLAPLVCGWIEYDNRESSEPVQLIFGLGDPSLPLHPLGDTTCPLPGFAAGTSYGFATAASKGVSLRQGFDIFNPKFKDYRGLHVIGGESALIFDVPAGKRKRFPLVLGFYQQGQVSTGINACFLYTLHFSGLEDVLKHGIEHHSYYTSVTARRDRELASSGLSEDQQFLISQATHSYLGNTELLLADGKPLWVVNEGEYRMINTFDLTVDHLFYELELHPWTVRNTLDLFVSRYSYRDHLQVRNRRVRGGISFTHDMGVMNHFTPPGRSSYECDELHGCFSHMTMEQLLNWVLCAVTYAQKTGDKAWLRKNRAVLLACIESMQRRDDPQSSKRDGLLKYDSERCGKKGSEITTYDSLDVSLGQARNNLYLAVKTLGAWLLIEQACRDLRETKAAASARASALSLAGSICSRFEKDSGFFPAVFEAGNRSRILPAVEGLAYPLYLGLKDATDFSGPFGELLGLLKQHLSKALVPGVCIDPVSGGWKMSSTSTNTWFSKIALSQWVVSRVFPETLSNEALAADKVHADWQRRPGCGAFAMCDQIHSDTGLTCGSRYYPRGVTTFLWLKS